MVVNAVIWVSIFIGLVNGQYSFYPTPHLKIVAFEPRGVQVSIPHEPGILYFGFHGNVNKEIDHLKPGQIFGEVIEEVNGRWTYHDVSATLKKGDVVYYWFEIVHNELRFTKKGNTYTIEETVPSIKHNFSSNSSAQFDLVTEPAIMALPASTETSTLIPITTEKISISELDTEMAPTEKLLEQTTEKSKLTDIANVTEVLPTTSEISINITELTQAIEANVTSVTENLREEIAQSEDFSPVSMIVNEDNSTEITLVTEQFLFDQNDTNISKEIEVNVDMFQVTEQNYSNENITNVTETELLASLP